MNKNEWFEDLKRELDILSEEEKQKAVEYYEELFDDKSEGGASEEEILSEFGSPRDAAKKIKEDAASEYASAAPENESANDKKEAEDIEKDFPDVKVDVKESSGHKVKVDVNIDHGGSRFESIFSTMLVFGCLIFFLLDGSLFGRWHPAWLVFLLIPVGTSLVHAIRKGRPNLFAYAPFVALIYLAIGCYFRVWHPTWIIFLTIPIYHTICSNIGRSARQTERETTSEGGSEKGKFSRGWLVAGIVCSAISITIITIIVLSVIGGSVFGWRFLGMGYTLKDINETITINTDYKEVTEIKVDTSVVNVYIEPTNGDKITVGYVNDGKYTVTAEENGGVVEVKTSKKGWSLFDFTNRVMLIKVPQYVDYQPLLTVKASTADVKINVETEDVVWKTGDIAISVTTGSVKIFDVKSDNVAVSTSTGSIKLSNVESENVALSATTGSVTMKGVTAKKIAANTSTGSVNAECTGDEVKLETTTGSVNFTIKSDDIDLKTSTGSIRGKVKGKKDEYNIEVSTSTGSHNIDTTIVKGSLKYLKATTGTGSIKVEFEE